ncbi:ubiquinol-cytochrome C reductase [Xylariaceae sp. FL1651]|nr:ubiquinol-cytochrome C reductase [Xylariaceae sp. FL1651]
METFCCQSPEDRDKPPPAPSTSKSTSLGTHRRIFILANYRLCSALFRRNYQMLGVVFVSAFAFEMAYDTTMNKIWDNLNKGRQWKDIRSRYVEEE